MIIGVDANEANVEKRVGSNQYAYEIVKHVAVLTEDQIVVYLKNPPRADLPQPSEYVRYEIFGPKLLWTQIALPLHLYTQKKPDVIFSLTHYAPRFSPVPSVVTIHDLSYLKFPEYFLKKDLEQLKNWTAYSVKQAAHVIVPSQATKQDVVNFYHKDASFITVVPHGYDQERFHPNLDQTQTKQIRQKYNLPESYLLYVGTLQPRKNLLRLLEAYKKILEQKQTDMPLVIAGKKGWLFEEIFATVMKLALEKHVIFTDYVLDDEVPFLYAGASLSILPSLYEGFGMPIIEAMACGTIVAASNNSSLPEIIGPGLLFDPLNVDAIAQTIVTSLTLSDTDKAAKKAESIAFAQRFSWEKAAKATLEVLHKAGDRG